MLGLPERSAWLSRGLGGAAFHSLMSCGPALLLQSFNQGALQGGIWSLPSTCEEQEVCTSSGKFGRHLLRRLHNLWEQGALPYVSCGFFSQLWAVDDT